MLWFHAEKHQRSTCVHFTRIITFYFDVLKRPCHSWLGKAGIFDSQGNLFSFIGMNYWFMTGDCWFGTCMFIYMGYVYPLKTVNTFTIAIIGYSLVPRPLLAFRSFTLSGIDLIIDSTACVMLPNRIM